MTTLDPEQAYRAVVAFLDQLWEQRSVPGDLGDLRWMCFYIPGKGTRDPAMWYDWLGAAKLVQTGKRLSDREVNALTPADLEPLSPEQAYQAMFMFMEDYYLRVSRPPELGDLLGRMRYTVGTGTADPEIWQHWLAAVRKSQATLRT